MISPKSRDSITDLSNFLSSEGILLCFITSWHSKRGNRKFLEAENWFRWRSCNAVWHSPESLSENVGMYGVELSEATGRRPAGTRIFPGRVLDVRWPVLPWGRGRGRRLSACFCHWAVGLGAAWCGREVPGSILQTCLPTTVGYTLVCEVIIPAPGQEVGWDCQPWNKCLWVQVTGQLWEPTCQAGPEAEVWLQ